MNCKIAAAVVVAVCASTLPAHAGTVFSFSRISNGGAGNIGGDAAAGEAQLFVEVSAFSGIVDTVDPDGNGPLSGLSGVSITGVEFRFFNIGPLASSITDIYFEDGVILDLTAIVDDDDNTSLWNGFGQVDYSFDADKSGNLPGGNQAFVNFNELAGFLAEPDPPVQPNGINPGEEASIIWTLQSGQTAADAIAALLSGILRIGIHVQGFATGGSESFVNNGCIDCNTTLVPLPSAAGMGLLGMGGLMMIRRRRS